MESITLTKSRINQILPENIKNSDVMSNNAKKTLAAILNYFVSIDKAKDNGYVYLSNETLRSTIKIGKNQMLNAIQELCEFNLIKRERGEKWTNGKQKTASKYFVYTKKLYEPLVKPCASDLLACIPDASSPTVTVTVKDTVSVKVSDTVKDKDSVEDKKENISNNIIDNTTVIEDDPKQGEPVKENVSKDIKPAYANTAYAKTLEDFFNELKIASTVSEVNRAFVGASRLIEETDINGRLTLLQAVADTIKRNNVDFSALDGEEPDEKVVRLEDLFSTPTQPTELLKRIDRIKPLSIQLTVGLRRLSKRLIPRETSISWWKEGLRK